MYDKLVKGLREAHEDAMEYGTNPFRYSAYYAKAADAIEELDGLLYEAERDRDEYRERLDKTNDILLNPWIPVTERLPGETWERVLAYTDEGQIMTLPSCKVGNGYVTHWMQLPQPPKEVTCHGICQSKQSESGGGEEWGDPAEEARKIQASDRA